MNVTHPVLVLGLHHGALGIARSLGRWGVPVYGATEDPSIAAARSRYFRHVFRWSTRDRRAAVDQLVELGRRLDRPLLLPTSDVTTLLVEDNAEEIGETFEFLPQRAGLARALSSKQGMHELCLAHGVPTPRTIFPQNVEDAASQLDGFAFPVVLKLVDSSRPRAHDGPRTVLAATRDQALTAVSHFEGNALVQEYIPGGSESVWMFNGYFDGSGNCIFGLTGRKLRQHPVSGGVTSLGQCVPNEVVDRATREFMSAVGYRGILDCGYRYDARDGAYKLLDVNPRIGSTFRLFVDSAGLDVARVWYLDTSGQPVEPGDAVDGRTWLVEDIDLLASSRHMRDGVIGPRAWLRSLRRVDETAWLAIDDLRPALRQPVFRLRMLLRRLLPARKRGDEGRG